MAVAALAAATTFTAQGAQAQAGMARLAKVIKFSDLDTNKDGMISEEEFKTAPEIVFARQDANGNGKLSRSEIVAFLRQTAEAQATAMISRMDKDKDGSVSFEEITRRRPSDRMMARVFSRVDADESGGISSQELDESVERLIDRKCEPGWFRRCD